MADTDLVGALGQLLERVIAARVEVEDSGHQWAAHRIDIDAPCDPIVHAADLSDAGVV